MNTLNVPLQICFLSKRCLSYVTFYRTNLVHVRVHVFFQVTAVAFSIGAITAFMVLFFHMEFFSVYFEFTVNFPKYPIRP